MSTIYLHVGPHKTGSSYLQNLWNTHTEVLEKNGLIYPKTFYRANGHHQLTAHLLTDNFGKEFQKDAAYLNALQEDIILSSESFSNLKKKHFLKLKEVFRNKNIKIIYYFRNPTQRFLSEWQETIKQGSMKSFFEYSNNHFMKPLHSRKLNPLPFLEDLVNVFGRENLYLIDYNNAYSNMSMMAEFEKIPGKKKLIPDIDKTVNKMRDLAQIEILRLLNYKAFQEGWLKHSNVRQIFYKKLRKNLIHTEALQNKLHKYDTEISLGDTMVDKRIFQRLNQNFKNCFVNDISEMKDVKYHIISDKWLLDKDLLKEVDNIYHIIAADRN